MYQSESAPWLWFRAWNTDGSAKTDLVFNTSGISIAVARDNLANSSALSLSAASSPTDWAAGKLSQVAGNLYRVGIATASISSYTGNIAIAGSYTGGTLEGILDYVSAYDPSKNPLSPTTPGRTLDVSSGGEAGIDLANVGSPTTALNLSGLTIKNSTDVKTIVDLIYAVVQLTDASVSTMAVDTRNAILNRVLAGNHTTSGTVGLLLQFLDALISSRLAPVVPGRTIAVSATSGKVTAEAVELDSSTQTQIDTIESAVSSIGSQATTVERSVSDTNAITFAWPVSGATITGTRSLNNGSYGAVAGAIAFLRTETGKHYYTLAYNSADRPAAEGQVRYKFIDGTYTGYVVVRVEPDLTPAQVNAQVLDVLSVDTFAELVAPPAATSSLKDKITWLFMYARNKVTQTATTRTLYRDDTTTVAGTSGTSDNGTTFTKGEDA